MCKQFLAFLFSFACLIPAHATEVTIGQWTLPNAATNFSATGGTSQFLKQNTAGGAVTPTRPVCADLSDAASGCSAALGTGVAAALAINVGSAGAFVTFNGALGTPSSGVGTNITNVNAATLGGATFAAPGTIGGGTPGAGFFTTVSATGSISSTGTGTGLLLRNNAGSQFAAVNSGSTGHYLIFNNPDGTAIFQGGDSSDPTLYFDHTTIQFTNLANNVNYAKFTSTGLTTQTTTASTSKTTGSIISGGGLGVAGATFTDTLNIITVANTSTTRALCWDNTTGLVSENGTVGTCTVSKLAAKDLIDRLTPESGFKIVMAMEPWRYTMKKGLPTYKPGEQIGFIADFALVNEPRLVATDGEGAVEGFLYEQYTAALTAAYKHMNTRIQALEAR